VEGDGLDLKVAGMPPTFTSRFGEVVWAQGGPGYGWWPCYIYDPRMTVGGARDLAKKHLSKKHLVYFFQCLEAPFAALSDSKISEWFAGLTENYHLGKAARHTGKNRAIQFSEALKIANLELGKPIEHRMEWNHPDPATHATTLNGEPLLSPNSRPRSREKKKRSRSRQENIDRPPIVSKFPGKPSVRTNLVAALEAHNSAVVDEDDLYIRIMRGQPPANVGFVKFGSRQSSTFVDARWAMMKDLDCISHMNWKFHIPELGPISTKQEEKLGPILSFLQRASTDLQLGDGTIRRPVKVLIIDENDIPALVE
jgi:hypothetical protein